MSSSTEIKELSSEKEATNVEPQGLELSQSPASKSAQIQEIDQEPNADLKRAESAQSIEDSKAYDYSVESPVESESPNPPVQSDETAGTEIDSGSTVPTNDQSAPEVTAEKKELNTLDTKKNT